jgi:hypothetical protein
MIVAGRSLQERVEIAMDMESATTLFAPPGDQFGFYDTLEELWEVHVKSQLP